MVSLGDAPQFVWWFVAAAILILSAALAASRFVRALAVLELARGRIRVALAALQLKTEKSTPSKRTASK